MFQALMGGLTGLTGLAGGMSPPSSSASSGGGTSASVFTNNASIVMGGSSQKNETTSAPSATPTPSQQAMQVLAPTPAVEQLTSSKGLLPAVIIVTASVGAFILIRKAKK